MRPAVVFVGAMLPLLLLVVLPGSLRANESITGTIKEVRTKGIFKDVIANILLEKYRVHISKETVIVFSDARKATVADLKVGQRVRVQSGSNIFDTDPPQIYAAVIVIQVKAR